MAIESFENKPQPVSSGSGIPAEPDNLGDFFRKGKVYTPVQALFLGRILRLSTLKSDVGLEPWQSTLVRKAIYSSLMDCKSLDVEDEARAILLDARRKSNTPPNSTK